MDQWSLFKAGELIQMALVEETGMKLVIVLRKILIDGSW